MQILNLVGLYAKKTDEELLALAEDVSQLTPEAHAALLGELTRRRIQARKPVSTEDGSFLHLEPRTRRKFRSLGSYDSGKFIVEVLRLYHRHFWFFVKLVVPPVVIGYVTVLLRNREGWHIIRQLPPGGLVEHPGAMFEIFLVNMAGQFVSWTAFCFAFGAICSAVLQIQLGDTPSVIECFVGLGRRIGVFLRLTLVLFLLCSFAFGVSGLFIAGVSWSSIKFQVHLNGWAWWMLSFLSLGLCLLVLSRFALSVPAILLDEFTVSKALFRSDELTEGKWSILAALLSKSLIGGYVAGMCPFWLASWIPSSVSLPPWFSWALKGASIAGVSAMEPPMFIGFTLLYIRTAGEPAVSNEALTGQTV